jgi:hypothetical protein
MTKDEIKARFDAMIDDIVEADRDHTNCRVFHAEKYRAEYDAARRKLLDAIMEYYVDA